MRAKYFVIYLLLGAAFLAVSLWVFLTGGRSRKAVNAKYKLGGLLLSTWALVAAASCQGGLPPTVTCYEPMVECYDPMVLEDEITVQVKGKDNLKVQPGDVLIISIHYRTSTKYCVEIHEGTKITLPLLQEAYFTFPEDLIADGECELTVADTEFKGTARLYVYAFYMGGDGNEHKSERYNVDLTFE